MFAVVFEVLPAEGKRDEYLGLAKHLKPILEAIDGFIDNERFESKRRPGWVLSLSTWQDEKAVVRWRSQREHHKIQGKGRDHVFADYHLRVCEVTADSHPPNASALVQQRLDETAAGNAKALAITELSPGDGVNLAARHNLIPSHVGLDLQHAGLVDHDMFESIYNPGKMLLLTSWKTANDAQSWTPATFPGVSVRHRRLRTVRDYGMFERRETPQYHPDVHRP